MTIKWNTTESGSFIGNWIKDEYYNVLWRRVGDELHLRQIVKTEPGKAYTGFNLNEFLLGPDYELTLRNMQQTFVNGDLATQAVFGVKRRPLQEGQTIAEGKWEKIESVPGDPQINLPSNVKMRQGDNIQSLPRTEGHLQDKHVVVSTSRPLEPGEEELTSHDDDNPPWDEEET